MGQEIDRLDFNQSDFNRFYSCLETETKLLESIILDQRCSQRGPVAGFEIEAWLVDTEMSPAPINQEFLKAFNDPLASPELAKFNIELNNNPIKLTKNALSELHSDLDEILGRAETTAERLDSHIIMIGTLPTLKQSSLNLQNMSTLNRFRALNEQILNAREMPIQLEINGNQHLKREHRDLMLESATTSFQVHIQTPLDQAHKIFNASIMASAPMVAISANSPFLFGSDLWSETRIPLFEQSIATGGYNSAAQGPLRRVSFGSGYARNSIFECFRENLEHFPILLPTHFQSRPEQFEYLRLHNGTIWRWNRPLVGFDRNGTPHIRIEHRVMASGPSIVDMMANAAFYYGLTLSLAENAVEPEPLIPFSAARDNFYQAARLGLNTTIRWVDGEKSRIQALVLSDLLDRAKQGLSYLEITESDAEFYLGIIRERVESGITGCEWQRRAYREENLDFKSLTARYLKNQTSGKPVHSWELC